MVYQKTRKKCRFGIPLGHKTAKTRSRCFQIRNQSGTSQSVLQCAVHQAQVKTGEPLGFARRSWLEPLAGVFASGGAATTNEPLAFVFANGDACCEPVNARRICRLQCTGVISAYSRALECALYGLYQ